MRALAGVLLVFLFVGCVAPGEALQAANADGLPCGLSVTLDRSEIRVGELVRALATMRNCGHAPMHWVDAGGCGFGPWLKTDDGRQWVLQQGTARDDVLCPDTTTPQRLEPGGQLQASGLWNGKLGHGDRTVAAPAGAYEIFAHAGSGDGPTYDAQGVVLVTSA